jgi:hypothetical protein
MSVIPSDNISLTGIKKEIQDWRIDDWKLPWN